MLIMIELDAIANGGDALLTYTSTSLKDERLDKKDTEHSLLMQFNIDVFDPYGLRVRILENV